MRESGIAPVERDRFMIKVMIGRSVSEQPCRRLAGRGCRLQDLDIGL